MSQSGTFRLGTGGGAPIETLTGDAGGAVSPTAGNINVVGGNNITTTGNPGTSTITIDVDGGVSDTFNADVGSAIPALGIITMAGGTNFNTSAAGSTVIFNLDDDVTLAGFLSAGTTISAGTGLTVTTGNADVLAGNLNVGTATPANPARIAIEESVAGSTGMSIQNTLVNASASAIIQHITEVGGGDAFSNYVINGGQNWSVGIDNSDTDAFKITTGTSPSGGTTVLSVTTGLAMSMPATSVTMNGGVLNFGTDASDNAINIGTNAALQRDITIGNNVVLSTVSIIGGGTISLTSDDITIDSNGVLEINNAGAPISIGNDADAQNINIGTGAAARTITIGNTTGATALNLDIGTGDFTLDSATGNIITALDTGEINYPLQPAFAAFLGTTDADVTGNGTGYTLGSGNALTEIFDQNGDFVTTGTFTAPVTGRYRLSSAFLIQQADTATTCDFTIVTSNRTWRSWQMNPSAIVVGTNAGFNMSIFADMDAADTADTRINATGVGADTVDVFGGATNPRTWFSGNLVA